jgi:pimeloyl-ACP methyl ester carboxylesterase
MSVLLAALVAIGAGDQGGSATRWVASRDGTKIAFDVAGSGPVVILLHGGGQTRRDWHRTGYVARLAREFTVVTMDIRGNGESDKPATPDAFHVDRIKEDILAVAGAVGAERFTLWGFSYGANVGRYLAAASDRVTGMVYIGIPFGLAAGGGFRERILEMEDAAPPWVKAMLDYPAVEPADMRCPTLWLVGTANENTMASVRAYQPKLAGTRVTLAIVEGLTHPQELEQIDQVFPQEIEFTRSVAR